MNIGEYTTSLFEVTKTKTGKESQASAKHVASRVLSLDAVRLAATGHKVMASQGTMSAERADKALEHALNKLLTERQAQAMMDEAGRTGNNGKPVFPELQRAAALHRAAMAAQAVKEAPAEPAQEIAPPQAAEQVISM